MRLLSLVILTCLSCVTAGYALDIRGPYLTGLESGEATIVVHTDEDVEAVIEYEDRKNKNLSQKKASPAGGRHIFNIEGLTPGTEYTYRILFKDNTGNFVDQSKQTNTFSTPPQNLDEFSFIAYGDSRDSSKKPKRHELIASQFLKYKPLFIISTGDILLGGKSATASAFNDDWTLNFFRPLRNVINSVPYLVSAGNHELDSPEAEQGFRQVFPTLKESFNYSFRYGRTSFIVLNTPNRMKEFQNQKQWFIKELEKAGNADWRVVFLHVSPFTNGKYLKNSWTLDGREDFLKTCVENKVDLVFSGHDHSYQRFHPLRFSDNDSHAVLFVVTGLAGTNAYKAEPGEFTAQAVNNTDHFCVVNVTHDRLSLKAYNNNNQLIDEAMLSKGEINLGKVWQSVTMESSRGQ